MLHTGLLPHHPRWAAFLENLRWVVLDELHVYRGVFGSNVANLLRRLRRVCRFYGSEPAFVMTSATIANPKELAERLIEAPVRLIPSDLDGSPRAEKHVLLYNPPVVDPRLGIRRAYTLEATRLAARFIADDVQTAVFARSRRTTEVILGYLKDTVAQAGGNPEGNRGYRGGHLPLGRGGGGAGRRPGAGARCEGSSPPMPLSWASISDSWVRPCWPAIRERWPRCGSRQDEPAGAGKPRSPS